MESTEEVCVWVSYERGDCYSGSLDCNDISGPLHRVSVPSGTFFSYPACAHTHTHTLTHKRRCLYLPVQYKGPKAFLNFRNPAVCTMTMSSSLMWPEARSLGNMAVHLSFANYYFLHWIPFICQALPHPRTKPSVASVPAYRNVEGFPSGLQIPPCAVYARGRAGTGRCVGAVLHVLFPA